MSKENKMKGLFCISFDAVATSGIIVEFLKIAKIFNQNSYAIYLDLGYEIKADKNNFFKPYTHEKSLFPSWVNLIKVLEQPFNQYSTKLVEHLLYLVIHNSFEFNDYSQLIENYSDHIADKFVTLWNKLNIHVVIVEN